jgi:uncharacterized protein YpiB (UPF0302 family)
MDTTELVVTLRNFANALKNQNYNEVQKESGSSVKNVTIQREGKSRNSSLIGSGLHLHS